ncbi:MAG: T9SS type A sorting domain-containing protein [Flavobacteriales bacterium]|nr:T9SS type A sorting domain-containing protein [Flavobacteriales bacterium]
MKNILGLMIVLFSCHWVQAQVTDTLGWSNFSQGTEILYESPNGGYAFGTNGYADKAKAQTFTDTVSHVLRGALLKFGAVEFNSQDSSSSVLVNVYLNDGNGITAVSNSDTLAPNTIVTSVKVPVYQLVNGGLTEVGLDNDTLLVFYSGELFSIGIAFDSLAVGDTVGLVSTTDGDAGGSYNAWELTANSNWIVVAQAAYSWNLDVDLGIFALTDRNDPAGVVETRRVEQISVYPNPVVETLNVNLQGFQESDRLNMTIFDQLGRAILTWWSTSHELTTLDVSTLPMGIYHLQIESDLQVATAKFVKR